MREQLKTKLEEQAEWRRRKAVEWEDHRNIEAAELLDRLAATVADVPQHLLDAYQAAFERHDTLDVILNEQIFLRGGLGGERASFSAPDRGHWASNHAANRRNTQGASDISAQAIN
jgi:hypothetical protein